MSEFIYLYRATESDRKANMGTPELAQKSMQAWLGWMRDLEQKGHIKNPGQPLEVTVRGSQKVVTDGPFVEAKDLVLGYTVIQARDLKEAAELAKGCPILAGPSGTVEIRPVLQGAM